MYRIELSPGEETAFRSIEELAVAIRRKVVTARARIYHNATGKWLPIQFHPHYKLAFSMPLTQADLVAGPPVTPLSGLKLGEPAPRELSSAVPSSATREAATQAALSAWPEPKPNPPAASKPVAPEPKKIEPARPPITLGTPFPEPRRSVEPIRSPEPRRAAPARFVEQVRAEEPAREKASRRRRKPLRALRVALAGALLIACGHLVVSAASTADPEVTARPRTPRRLIRAPAEALKDVAPRTVAAVMPVLQSIPVPGLIAETSRAPAPKGAAPNSAAIDSVPEPIRIDSAPALVSAPAIQPAPDAGEITAVPGPAGALAPQLVDSSGKRALKRILRTIGGSPTPDGKSPKP